MQRLWPAVLVLAVALGSVPALGDSKVVPPPELGDSVAPPPPGGVSVSPSGRVVMSSSVCPALLAAAAIPGADYQPGIDVDGNKVAPADLPSDTPPLALDNFPIEISVKLQRRYHIPADSTLFQGKALIGLVTVHDGRAYFNGQPISQGERDMMIAACSEKKR